MTKERDMFSRNFRSFICATLLAAAPCALAQEPEKAKADAPAAEAPKADSGMTEKQKTSYAVGIQFGNAIADGATLIDLESMIAGMKDAMEKKDPKITDEEMGKCLQDLQKQMNENRFGANKKTGEDFLAENGKKDGVKTLPSGLQYKVITEGTGKIPAATDKVSTHYRGTFLDGKEFDSSYKRNQPAEFGVTQVIAGWTEALQLMKEGSKWELYVPYSLAYGEEGRPPQIPPYSMLVFQVELLKIVDATAPAGQSVTIKPSTPKEAAPK